MNAVTFNPKLINDCKKLLGLVPYNVGSNFSQGCGYFGKAIEREFGEAQIDACCKALREGKVK